MSSTLLSPEFINAIAATLRTARERRGDGFGEIALRIALTSSQLKAIEAGNLQPFYSGTYYLQAAQRYADFLGVPLPTEESVGMTPPSAPAVSPPAPPPDPPPTAPPPTAPPPTAPPALPDASSTQTGPDISPAEPPPEYLITRQAPSQDDTHDTQLHANEVIVTSLSAPAENSASAATVAAADASSNDSLSTRSASAVALGQGTRPGMVAVEIREDPRSLPWGWILLGIAALIVSFVAVTSLRSPAPPVLEAAPVQETPAQPASPADGSNTTGSASPGPTTPAGPGTAPASPAASPAKSSGNNPATSGNTAGSSAAPATTPPTAPRTPAPAPVSPATPAIPATPAGSQPPAVPGSTSSPQPAQGGFTRVLSGSSADSHLESQAGTWVQIVRLNGEKVNLRIEAGQKVDFAADSTAAIVFGQPERAVLRVKGKSVNLNPFLTGDSPQRALVILSQIRE